MQGAVLELSASPHAPEASPVRIRYRDCGRGTPLVFLHGGWGYEMYPLDRQIAALAREHRVVIPDRSGYGGSTAVDRLHSRFHEAAAVETQSTIDALGLDRPVLWGHSDGAVIAALVALADPDRIGGVILEASHWSGHKPRSREFFEQTASDPDSVGARAAAVLAHDHGPGWRKIIARQSEAWLRLAVEHSSGGDLYGGRLHELRVPALLVHGLRDPRTEPGELEAIAGSLPHAQQLLLAPAGHSPHSESATADEVTDAALRFLR